MQVTFQYLGDGTTHYYHQGPVFKGDPVHNLEQELRWNPDEDTNEKRQVRLKELT